MIKEVSFKTHDKIPMCGSRHKNKIKTDLLGPIRAPLLLCLFVCLLLLMMLQSKLQSLQCSPDFIQCHTIPTTNTQPAASSAASASAMPRSSPNQVGVPGTNEQSGEPVRWNQTAPFHNSTNRCTTDSEREES